MPRGGLAFYNCGPVSGASQPHKHVQIVPLPLDADASADAGSSGDGGSSGVERPPIWPAVSAAADASGAPAGQPFEVRNLPFAAFAATLAPPQQAEAVGPYLAAIYSQLLARCTSFVEGRKGQRGVTPQDGSLSYNWGACRGAACWLLVLEEACTCGGAAGRRHPGFWLRISRNISAVACHPFHSVHAGLHAGGAPASGVGGTGQVSAGARGCLACACGDAGTCGCALPNACSMPRPPNPPYPLHPPAAATR